MADEPRPLSFDAARRAHMQARRQESLEAMARGLAHPVTVEAALDWDDHEHLGALLAAMDARPEFLWPPVGANLGERVISVTVMVRATSERAAQEAATVALLDEMQRLGMAGEEQPPDGCQAGEITRKPDQHRHRPSRIPGSRRLRIGCGAARPASRWPDGSARTRRRWALSPRASRAPDRLGGLDRPVAFGRAVGLGRGVLGLVNAELLLLGGGLRGPLGVNRRAGVLLVRPARGRPWFGRGARGHRGPALGGVRRDPGCGSAHVRCRDRARRPRDGERVGGGRGRRQGRRRGGCPPATGGADTVRGVGLAAPEPPRAAESARRWAACGGAGGAVINAPPPASAVTAAAMVAPVRPPPEPVADRLRTGVSPARRSARASGIGATPHAVERTARRRRRARKRDWWTALVVVSIRRAIAVTGIPAWSGAGRAAPPAGGGRFRGGSCGPPP